MRQPAVVPVRFTGEPAAPSNVGRRRRQARAGELRRRLSALQKDNAELHTALFEAAQVHRRLCAPRLVRHGTFDIASEVFAVRYLPGDFFAIEETAEGVVLALGDVCGKGFAAGMWTPCLVGLVRAHAGASPRPDAIMARVNREFCRMLAPLTSLLLMRLDPATGTVEYCNAGHPPALLLRGDGRAAWLSEGGMLLGMAPDAVFSTGRVEMRDGEVLLAYSDGVLEARNAADQEFGPERIHAQLLRSRADSAEAALYSLLGAVPDFAAPNALVDDTSIAVILQGAGAN